MLLESKVYGVRHKGNQMEVVYFDTKLTDETTQHFNQAQKLVNTLKEIAEEAHCEIRYIESGTKAYEYAKLNIHYLKTHIGCFLLGLPLMREDGLPDNQFKIFLDNNQIIFLILENMGKKGESGITISIDFKGKQLLLTKNEAKGLYDSLENIFGERTEYILEPQGIPPEFNDLTSPYWSCLTTSESQNIALSYQIPIEGIHIY